AAAASETTDPSHAEGRYLKARVALARGEGELAKSSWAVEPPTGARYAVVLPLIFQQTGELTEIPPLLSEPDVLLQIAADENRWVEEPPEDRLSRVGALLTEERRSLSPRHRARLLSVQAELNEELNREAAARRAWQQALDTDGYHPRYLYEIASRELTGGHPLDAFGRLSRCVASHPADESCQRAALMALLELDRIDEARAQVTAWEAVSKDATLAKAWLAVAEGRAGAALELLKESTSDSASVDSASVDSASIGSNPDDSGLAWYLSGLARGHQKDTRAGEELARASTLLAQSSHPELRMLAERARAAQIEHGPRSESARLVRTLRTEGSLDPVVHLHLGRYFESLGRRTDATQHFARAGQLAEQNGRVLFELGRVYYGPKTAWAFDLWQRYLELSPSGERAEQTQKRLEE
ncbi:MAG: tetratricopeptide (TPR) repeat protein, partial [Myxococcota bacterium]